MPRRNHGFSSIRELASNSFVRPRRRATGPFCSICAKGSSIPRHEHLGAGEYYVISGKMEVRGGVENGGITAITGDYGYEPNGVIHDMTNFPEDTVLYFTNFGPIRYICVMNP